MAETTKDLIFDEKNFNKGTAHGKELMKKSFSKWGAGRSILADKNLKIIAGNKSTESFNDVGYNKIQVVDTDGETLIVVRRNDIDLDTPEGREFALADNQTAKVNIDFDFDMMESEVEENVLEDWGINKRDKLVVDGEEIDINETFEPAEELGIEKEYLMIVFDSKEEHQEAIMKFSLKKQREVNNKNIKLNNVGIQRVMKYEDLCAVIQ